MEVQQTKRNQLLYKKKDVFGTYCFIHCYSLSKKATSTDNYALYTMFVPCKSKYLIIDCSGKGHLKDFCEKFCHICGGIVVIIY